LMPS